MTISQETAEEIVDALAKVNGSHPGFRAVHAKGTFWKGSFTATAEAAQLSVAGHLQGDPVRVTGRFSNASGNPRTSDANPIAGRGMAVKFHLSGGDATDIVSVPLVVFIARNPDDFLALTRARIPDPETGQPDPEKMAAFVAEHPETANALQLGLPNLAPTTSYVTSLYNALHAFALVDADGGRLWGRYHWIPEAGVSYLSDSEREAADRDYLQVELGERLAAGSAAYRLEFELANDGDPLADPTAVWEGGHETVVLGALTIESVIEDAEADGPVVFDPMRLTDGVEPSDDEILSARPAAYSVSVERRSA